MNCSHGLRGRRGRGWFVPETPGIVGLTESGFEDGHPQQPFAKMIACGKAARMAACQKDNACSENGNAVVDYADTLAVSDTERTQENQVCKAFCCR
jgi:hypothetical protein